MSVRMPAQRIACQIALVLVLVLTVSSAANARRAALVIGNSAYEKAGALANPANDATAVADAFKRKGFEQVTLLLDLDQKSLLKALKAFSEAAAGADVAAIYYAGHGLEVGGVNYLVPVDAELAQASDVEFEAVPLDVVLRSVESANGLSLVILDACRNNPFKLVSKNGGRSVGRGLAKIEPVANTLVAYAAKEGTVALDGADGAGNSPFATALIKAIDGPDRDIRLMLGQVRDDVLQSTGRKQEPYINGSLGGSDVTLSGGKPVEAAVAKPVEPAKPEDQAAKIWPTIEGTSSCAVLKSFASRFASSPYADFANARVYELNCDAPAVAAEPPKEDAAPEQAAALEEFYYVCCAKLPDNWLSLRTVPKGGSEITQMANGTLLKVIDQNGVWWQVETRDGQSGWAHSNWIKCCKQAPP